MTWAEFKQLMQDRGVLDTDEIDFLDTFADSAEEIEVDRDTSYEPPRVQVY